MTNFRRVIRSEFLIRNTPSNGLYASKLVIDNLRAAFTIQKSLSWALNSCILRIWNLSADKRNILKDYGDTLFVYAGYADGGGPQVLFTGTTYNVRHSFEFPDIVTTVECSDGELPVTNVLISFTCVPGTPARTVAVEIASRMGIDIVEFAPSPNLIYETGFQYSGQAAYAMQKVCKYLNLQWSVQNNQIRIIPVNGVSNKPPRIINSDMGMIGVPERYSYRRLDEFRVTPSGGRSGWRVRTVLRPDILPGDRALLQSIHLPLNPGNFRVEMVRHDGDTYSQPWYSQMELTLVNYPMPPTTPIPT